MDVVFIQIANITFCFQGYTCILFTMFFLKRVLFIIFFSFYIVGFSSFDSTLHLTLTLLISSLEEKLMFSLKAQG